MILFIKFFGGLESLVPGATVFRKFPSHQLFLQESLFICKKFFRTGVVAVILASLFSTFVVSPALADGVTWTSYSEAGVDLAWQSVAYGNNVFVAVNPQGAPRLMTSTNGTDWTGITPAQQGYQSVVYGNNQFVVVDNTTTASGKRVLTSPDGINWTSRTTPLFDWRSVTYGTVRPGNSPLFVAVGASGAVMTSEDGISWASHTTGIDSNWNAVTHGTVGDNPSPLFVAVGASGAVMTSENGIGWTSRTTGINSNWNAVSYGDGVFVVAGASGAVMTSEDGIGWTSRTTGINSNWNAVTYGDGIFVAVGDAGTVMTSINNGETWRAQTAAENNTNNWESVTYGTVIDQSVNKGAFVAVSSTGVNRVMRSLVTPPAFTITSSSESRTVNTAATGFIANSTGGPFARYTINATPPGMSFNTTTGALTGTPNTVASATIYTVTATNASGNATQTFTLTVTAAPVVADNSVANAEAARKAKEQRELTEILSIIPELGRLSLNLGKTSQALVGQRCVKKKEVRFVKKGAKCPKGFVKKV